MAKCQHYMLQIPSWRKIQKVGLSQEYKSSESEIGIWLKSIFGIAFLGPDEVEDAFVKYFMSIAHNDKRCTGFAYFNNPYERERKKTLPLARQ
jgi:hypothetical protein